MLEPVEEATIVEGTVTDLAGSVISNARIRLTSSGLQRNYTTCSDQVGEFSLSSVEVGDDYRLWVRPQSDYREYIEEPISIAADGANLWVTLDPLTNGRFEGQMIDSDGTPGGTTAVAIEGIASVGVGNPNIHITFVIDVSTSTLAACDSTRTVLECEQDGVNTVLIDPNITSVLDIGVSVFAGAGATADMTEFGGDDLITSVIAEAQTVVFSTTPLGVNEFTVKSVPDLTNFAAGLAAALNSVATSGADTKRVFFFSDGTSNTGGGNFAAALAALAGQASRIDTFAMGGGNFCGDGSDGTLQEIADPGEGDCQSEVDPADLGGLLQDLISTAPDSVQVAVDSTPISTTTGESLPAEGPVTIGYDATANLGVGTYEISATATGSGAGGSNSVTDKVTKQVLQLIASPPTQTNELSEDNEHTVNVEILGGAGPDRNNANNVDWHIIGNGDAEVTAVDQSGNVSDSVSCLVPPPPK